MMAFLKAPTDCCSMIKFGSEFQSLIVCGRKLCLYLFIFAPTVFVHEFIVDFFFFYSVQD